MTLEQSLEVDGGWSDSDGHVTKFEWDLDGDGVYEIARTPGTSNHDVRTLTFTVFGDHTIRLRVTDDDGPTDFAEGR